MFRFRSFKRRPNLLSKNVLSKPLSSTNECNPVCDSTSSIVCGVILAYLSSTIIYTGGEMWIRGKNRLIEHREHLKVSDHPFITQTTEKQVVNSVLSEGFDIYFTESIFWPFLIIPRLILHLCPEYNDNLNDSKINKNNDTNVSKNILSDESKNISSNESKNISSDESK